MADDELPTSPANTTTKPETENTATAGGKKRSSSKKTLGKADTVAQKAAKPKLRGLSDEEKLVKIKQVEAAVAGGTTLKDAVSAAAISDQTYYTWKKSFAAAIGEASTSTTAFDDDELAEFAQLEEENRRLRKLLAEKLRAENAVLRKRLGMS